MIQALIDILPIAVELAIGVTVVLLCGILAFNQDRQHPWPDEYAEDDDITEGWQ